MRPFERGLSTAVLVVVVISGTYAQESSFRGIPYGADREEVIDTIGEPDAILDSDEVGMVGDEAIQYWSLPVAGYTAEATIEFRNDAMIGASYGFDRGHDVLMGGVVDPKAYTDAYDDLVHKLSIVYGEPETSVTVDAPGGFTAYAARRLQDREFQSTWTVGDSMVIVNLSYSDDQWGLAALYVSPEVVEEMSTPNTQGL